MVASKIVTMTDALFDNDDDEKEEKAEDVSIKAHVVSVSSFIFPLMQINFQWLIASDVEYKSLLLLIQIHPYHYTCTRDHAYVVSVHIAPMHYISQRPVFHRDPSLSTSV